MDTEQAFLDAILASPAEDAPRQMYADWLQERRDPRGEFISVQLALARTPSCSKLLAAERELLHVEHALAWAPPQFSKARQRTLIYSGSQEPLRPLGWGRAYGIKFCRGFVEEIACPSYSWAMLAKSLVENAPLREVTLNDLPEYLEQTVGGIRLSAEQHPPRSLGYFYPFRDWESLGRPRTDRDSILAMLAAEWPRIKFHLPEPRPQMAAARG